MTDSREIDAYEEAGNRDIKTAKAFAVAKPDQIDICDCGHQMGAIRRHNGYTWVCPNVLCQKTRFEADSK